MTFFLICESYFDIEFINITRNNLQSRGIPPSGKMSKLSSSKIALNFEDWKINFEGFWFRIANYKFRLFTQWLVWTVQRSPYNILKSKLPLHSFRKQDVFSKYTRRIKCSVFQFEMISSNNTCRVFLLWIKTRHILQLIKNRNYFSDQCCSNFNIQYSTIELMLVYA